MGCGRAERTMMYAKISGGRTYLHIQRALYVYISYKTVEIIIIIIIVIICARSGHSLSVKCFMASRDVGRESNGVRANDLKMYSLFNFENVRCSCIQ